jgi:hypothetical protein
LADTLQPDSPQVRLTHDLARAVDDFHYVYVRLTQADGNRAWSSPIWFTKP